MAEIHGTPIHPDMPVLYGLHPGLLGIGAHRDQRVEYRPVMLAADYYDNFIVSPAWRRRPDFNGNLERSPGAHPDLRGVVTAVAGR